MPRRLAVLVSATSLLVVGAVAGVVVDRMWLAHRSAGSSGDVAGLHRSLIEAVHGGADRARGTTGAAAVGSGADEVTGPGATAAASRSGTTAAASAEGTGLDPMSSAHILLELHNEALRRMGETLDLDDAQLARIDSLFRDRQHGVDETWHMLHDRLQAALDSVHREIMSLLRPEQREAFRRWIADPGGAAATLHPHGRGG